MKKYDDLVKQLYADFEDYNMGRAQAFNEVTARSANAANAILQLQKYIKELAQVERPTELPDFYQYMPARPMKIARDRSKSPGGQAMTDESNKFMEEAKGIREEAFFNLGEAERRYNKLVRSLKRSVDFNDCLIEKIRTLENENRAIKENNNRLKEYVEQPQRRKGSFVKREQKTMFDRIKRAKREWDKLKGEIK